MDKTDFDGPILEIDKLSISFFTRLNESPAVMDFSVAVQPGEAVGLVGESGCKKYTIALDMMKNIEENRKIVGDTIKLKGRDLAQMSDEEVRNNRRNERNQRRMAINAEQVSTIIDGCPPVGILRRQTKTEKAKRSK